ncbi:formylglycine-generating enzyme family protein [Anditalea andensis]|uniref:Sulfatase-modifying factor n=1 Tax=Anditalea andensis TaxID=1048983 RepID=A0A074KWE1_9BACT|nr:SUMF1/EgtB/PvdO family nonheme iron enzyme [Anditalea andensis]KEO73239.1 sulfatase-modifying factor [Anditalea andensis]
MSRLKISLLFCFTILVAFQSVTHEEFTPYTQTIPDAEVTFDMVPIQGGTFMMGSRSGDEDENPPHQVEISSFWMGSHEVTWDIFEMFLDKNYEEAIASRPLPSGVDGLTRPSIPYLDMTFGMGKENKPAIGMTQYGAIQFCKWLYLKTGVFYRLPTEAEWEYASKAGSVETFFFGSDPSQLDEYAWYADNSGGETHPVGTKKPNPWGLYDILGNVMEWTSDQYDAAAYEHRAARTSKDPKIEITELYPSAIRGGSYLTGADDLRPSKRFASTPEWKRIDPQIPKSQWWFPEAPFLGLRLVRPMQVPSEEEISQYYDKLPITDY